MSIFNFSRHKRQSLYMPLSETSRFLLRKLGGSPEPLPQDDPALSPRIGTVGEGCFLYNAASGLMDVDFLHDGNENHHNPGYLHVVNSDIESESVISEGSSTSEISIGSEIEFELPACLTPGRLSTLSRPSIVRTGVYDLLEDNFEESVGIAPAPLIPRKPPNNKKKRPHETAYRAFNKAEAHLNDTVPPHSAIEAEIEQHLAEMKHQTAELRETLTACEAKLSQMTEQLAQSKSKSEQRAVSSEEPKTETAEYKAFSVQDDCPPMVERRNRCRRQGDPYVGFLHVDFTDAEQVDLLSHVNFAGMSAQRRRGRLSRALVA